jgi:putative ABC transport system permease protein
MSAGVRTRALAVRLFTGASWALPPRLRRAYADEIRRTFEERYGHAAARGRGALVAFMVRELQDVMLAGARARWRGRGAPVHGRRKRRMSAFVQDLRHAVRMFRRQPSFTLVAVLTLAVGIGITTAVFTVVNAVLLRPVPFDRVVLLLYGDATGESPWLSPLNYQEYVAQSGVFAAAAALTPATGNLTGSGEPERVRGARVTVGFFEVLGVGMTHGRGLAESDARGEARAVVLSDGLWRRRFGADAAIVGSEVTIDGRAYTVVGVAPPGISYPANVEFWLPLVFTPGDVAPDARGALWVQTLGRLKSGVSADQATSTLATIATRFGQLYPRTEKGSVARVIVLREAVVRGLRPALRLLLVAVSLVLTIACVNVAGLLLARGAQRGRELGVRAALGAGRWRLAAQLLNESVALGLLGVAAAVPIAYGLVSTLTTLAPAGMLQLADLRIDGRVLSFAIAIGIATSAGFGLAPAIFASRGGPVGALAGVTRGQAGAGRALRRALVVVEIALAVVLLASGGLLLRSYSRLRDVNPGFDARGVITFQVALPSQRYPDAAHAAAFTDRLLAGLRARPGVPSAAAAMNLPFGQDLGMFTGFRLASAAPGPSAQSTASLRIVSDEYFTTLTIPLRRGRVFGAGDTASSLEVALIDERFAERFFAGRDPIGQQILVSIAPARGGRNGAKTIVGVVGAIKSSALDQTAPAAIYLPYAQQPVATVSFAVKSEMDLTALIPSLRRDVASLDSALPLANLKPLADLVDGSVAARRFAMLLVLLFAGVAVALAAVGLYGVLTYLVAARIPEVGVRLALGASDRDVAWLFLREGLWLTLAGLAAGLAAARLSARLLVTSLFAVTPSDPATLASVVVMLGAVSLFAMALPVWRATRVNPTSLLRGES